VRSLCSHAERGTRSAESKAASASCRFLLLVGALALLLAGCTTSAPPGARKLANLEYTRAPGRPLKLDLYLPNGATNPLPVLVWIHGGAWKMGSKDWCPIAPLVTNGVAVASIEYRLSHEAKFPAQIMDCRAAIRWLRANAAAHGLDAERICPFGASAGGHLAALLGTAADERAWDAGEHLDLSPRVQCVVAFYPPTDLDALTSGWLWRKVSFSDVGRLIGGAVEQNRERVARANPVNYISNNTPPFYLLHGDRDRLVPIHQSELLHAALQRAGVPVHFEVVSGKGHAIGPPPEAVPKLNSFLRQHLGLHGGTEAATRR
jgi:acetyl esterase/lipase